MRVREFFFQSCIFLGGINVDMLNMVHFDTNHAPVAMHMDVIEDEPLLMHHSNALQWGLALVSGDSAKPEMLQGVHVVAYKWALEKCRVIHRAYSKAICDAVYSVRLMRGSPSRHPCL